MNDKAIQRRTFVVLVILLAAFLVSAGYLAENFLFGQEDLLAGTSSIYSSLYLFLLININIIAIMVLAFLLIRNIVRLVLDRQKGYSGSRLRTRLVLAFVGLSFFPTLVLFLLAKGIIGSVMQGWFAPQVGRSFEHSFSLVRTYYEEHEELLQNQINLLANDILPALGASVKEDTEKFSATLETYRQQFGYAEIAILSKDKEVLLSLPNLEADKRLPISGKAISDTLNSSFLLRAENYSGQEYLRGYTILPAAQLPIPTATKPDKVIMAVAIAIPTAISTTLKELSEDFDEYRSLASYRRPISSSYLLLLIGGTMFIIFLAIWVGFRLAANISEPIKLLAQGTEQLAKGNLDFRIPHVGDDELGTLVDSFNIMTSDLQKATAESNERRRYMETVLARIDLGVVSLDLTGHIRTCNAAAKRILRIDAEEVLIGRRPEDFLLKDLAERFQDLKSEVEQTHELVMANITVPLRNDTRHVQVTLTELVDENANFMGMVVLVDDLSELFKAQRLAAWRDVARRIAHEIKNPLTPIQLSAQRIQRRFADQLENAKLDPADANSERYSILAECLQTIVSQVQTLRNMVNEFSRFARLPKTSLERVDLTDLLLGLVKMYQEAHATIKFMLEPNYTDLELRLDRDQINRVFVNLLDNAVASVISYRSAHSTENYEPAITITINLDQGLQMVTIEFSDNGVGIEDSDKHSIFQPYFSKKKGGTGLGLAIVASIITDHGGFVRAIDNKPTGAIFRIELPIQT
ncbi:MAG: HAMP domain-containing protein [Deltaproteobacteria bacterium]|nr:HAMP domain-containing protein [Deltaproteobacteria bacterium]